MSDLGFRGREHGREALEEVEGILSTKCHKVQGQWQMLGSRGREGVWKRGRAQLHGDSKVSTFNTGGNRDDLANINILKRYALHKTNFHAITVAA